MIFSILSVTCLADMVLSLKQSSRMALFTVAPQKASPANGMARTLPIWTNRPLSGGATGKPTIRARSAPKKSRRFQEWKCPHGGNFNNPYSGNAKRNAPNAVQKQPNRPDRSGVRHECAIPTILICAARVFTALEGMRQARDGALLIPVLDTANNLQSLQRIYPDGTKRFLVGGKVSGGQFIIQGQPEKLVAVCEGFATGASIHLATG